MNWGPKSAAVGFFLFAATSHAQDCWTNTAGHAFIATLVQVTDTSVTFEMENGETNSLTLTALSPESQRKARGIAHLPEIPDVFLATFNICLKDLRRIEGLYRDGTIDIQERNDARSRIIDGFQSMYEKHQLPPGEYSALKNRLITAAQTL